ncbi:MAG: hypothetical protein ABRQ37_16690, partial [Candidatus Eremiobacterota bacterium]
REYKVWDGVSYLAYSFPETRETLTITTTCRQIGELIRLPFQHVATALQKLAKRGLITILKKGFWGKDGEKEPSIIQLNTVTDLVTQENSNNKPINKSVTHQVTKSVTPPSNQNSDTTKRNINKKHDMHANVSFINSDSNFSTKEKTKQPVTTMTHSIDKESIPITPIKDTSKQQEKANYKFTMGAGEFNNNVNNATYGKQTEKKELSSIGSIIASVPTPQVKEQPQPVNITRNTSPAITVPAVTNNSDLISAGVQEKAIYIGMNELKKRNIPDIPGTITALGAIIKGKKNIQNPSGYFVKLCKEVSLEHLFKPATASPCEHFASAVPSVEKTRKAAEEFWKEEKDSITAEEILTTLTKTCPDKLYTVIQDVNNDRKIQRGLSFMPEEGEARKLALENIILSEFKKKHPEIVI